MISLCPDNVYFLAVHRQTEQENKKPRKLFSTYFKLEGDEIIDINRKKGKCDVETKYWNKTNYKIFAKKLFKYWLQTKFAATTEYTDFWHIRKRGKIKDYKLYDCSLFFLHCCTHEFWETWIPPTKENNILL